MEVDRKLAELLINYPIIWDRSRKDFRDNNKKELAYMALADEIDTTVDVVMARYKSLREKFRKEKQKIAATTASGAGASDDDSWELYNTLSFLTDVMLPRRSSSNVWRRVGQNNVSQKKTQNDSQNGLQNPSTRSSSHDKRDSVQEVLHIEVGDELTGRRRSSSESTSDSPRSGRIPRPAKRKYESSPPAVNEMLATALLLTQPPKQSKCGKFQWLGNYIAESLAEMDAKTANQKVAAIIHILVD